MIDDLTDLKNDVREYIELRFDQFKLNTAEIISRTVSKTITSLIVISLLLFILLFLSLAAGFYIGSILDSTDLGFLCVAVFYLIMLIIFSLMRKHFIDRPVIKSVISLFFPKNLTDGKNR